MSQTIGSSFGVISHRAGFSMHIAAFDLSTMHCENCGCAVPKSRPPAQPSGRCKYCKVRLNVAVKDCID